MSHTRSHILGVTH